MNKPRGQISTFDILLVNFLKAGRKCQMLRSDPKGIALITVLIVAAIVMILSGLAYQFLIKSTVISGINLNYQTGISSLKAGAQYTKWTIDQYRINKALPPLKFGASNSSCLKIKLNSTRNNWSATCKKAADPINNYDIKISIGGYTVYAEIVDTVLGNTKIASGSTARHTGAVSQSKSGTNIITPPASPYLYRIELIATKGDIQSQVSALFGY